MTDNLKIFVLAAIIAAMLLLAFVFGPVARQLRVDAAAECQHEQVTSGTMSFKPLEIGEKP